MNRTNSAFRLRRWIAVAGLLLPIAAHAAIVTGTVTDKTTNRPDAGDQVVLISFGQGMQDAGSTKTDAQGHFSINVPDSNMHLLRVDHQKAAYFQPLPPGTKHVGIDVYDVEAKVKGVTTEADVMRLETDAQGLHVIESYFVKNESNPPKTQFSEHAYEIDLPADAQIDGAQAEGPQGMPVSSTPISSGAKGHYAFLFPVRPGETRFGVSYHIPYSGKFTFTSKVATPTDNFAIMLPNSMTFTPGDASLFQPVKDNIPSQTYLAKNVTPAEALSFTVSGTGAMPRDTQNQGSAAGDQAQGTDQGATAAQNDRPGGGLGVPIDTPDPLQKYKWWILSGLGLVLVAAAAFLLRGGPAVAEGPRAPMPSPLTPTVPVGPATAASESRAAPSATVLNALKEELFALETERVEGKLSEEQYADTKAALEVVLRRALARRS